MLVLTRKQRQQITIGDSITITVLRVKGQAVRIGIEAPDGVRILRAELNAIDVDDDKVEDVEVSTATSGTQRADQNGRRSRLGQDTENEEHRSPANRSQQQKLSSGAAPLANLRMAQVSLLNYR